MEVRLMGWLPRNTFSTLRNAVVVSVGGGKATVTIDGGDAAGLPIYGGSPAAGDKVLVAVQGDSMLVLGAGGQPTSGHAYGSVTASVPSAAATQLGIQSAPGAVAVSGGGLGPLILAKTGFWALTVSVEGFTGMNSGTRGFAEVRIQEGTDTRYLRANVGANEDRITVSGVVRVATGAKITFGAYTSAAGFTASGLYTVKYLGET
jgi:hypothetical protein